MALALYLRHRRDCKAAHPEQLHTSEFYERKKGYRRCDCPIVASGTLNRKFRRQTTAQWEWEPAKAVLAQWEAAGSWDGHKPEPSQPARTPDTEPQRTTILEATEAYLARSKASGVTEATLSKYNTSIKQLRAYCDSRGYVLIDQLTVANMDRFYATWKDGLLVAQRQFRKVIGHCQIPLLLSSMANAVSKKSIAKGTAVA